jgi:DNA-binding transcriptional LysR family regulator
MARPTKKPASKRGARAAPRSTAEESAPSARGWLNLRMIEMFVAVVQQDGMTNAAHRLGTTQSAVSQAITAIEAGLGAQLIDRSVRPMQLTRFGGKFYEHAVELLRRSRELEQVVDLQQNDRLSLVRIGMSDSFASTVGPHLLREIAPLASRWSVASGVQHTSLKALQEQLVDLMITSEDVGRSPHLIVLSVLREPFFIVAPKGMPVGDGSIEDLAARLPLIRYSARAFIGRQVEMYLQHHDVTLPRQYELDTSDAVLAMVKAGLGWTITTPLCVLKTLPALHDFQYLPLEAPGAVRRLRLVAHRDHHAQLWERVAATARAIMKDEWIPPIRALVPWDDLTGCD